MAAPYSLSPKSYGPPRLPVGLPLSLERMARGGRALQATRSCRRAYSTARPLNRRPFHAILLPFASIMDIPYGLFVRYPQEHQPVYSQPRSALPLVPVVAADASGRGRWDVYDPPLHDPLSLFRVRQIWGQVAAAGGEEPPYTLRQRGIKPWHLGSRKKEQQH